MAPDRSSDRAPRPPRLAEALLSMVLPSGAIRETVLGDLHELFLARVTGPSSGPGRARAWYWARALGLSARYGLRRLRGERFRGFVPDPDVHSTRREGMSSILRDFRIAFRSLRRSPGFTLPVLAILAMGMTAATAIFTVVDSIVFQPLSLPESHRIVIVCEDHPRLRGVCVTSPSNTEDLRRAGSGLAELGWGRGWPFHLVDAEGSEGVRGGLATASFFRALGARAVEGRLFRDDEVGAARDGVVVLAHSFWTTRYGQDPSVVGSTLRLEGEPYEVVGVLPEGFEAPFDLRGIELWKPPHVEVGDPSSRGWRGFRAIGRLAEGSSLAAAEAELSAAYRGLAERHDEIDADWRLRVESLQREVVGDARLVLLAFLGGAALLLVIVSANVANLVLARGLSRRSDFALQTALGARRGRLVRQILTEGLVLTLVATGVSVVLAIGVSQLLVAIAPPDIPRLAEVTFDARILAFTAAAALALTVAFGLLPALRATAMSVGGTLRSAAREGDDRGSGGLRKGLVVAELGLSVVLLASAGLLTRSFTRYLDWDPGFDPAALLAVSVFVDTSEHTTRAEFMEVLRRGEERVSALPGVVSAATASAGPLFGGGDGATSFATDETRGSAGLPSAWWFDIGPGYFETLGVPVLRGREFSEADGPDTEPVAIVNEAFVRAAWSDGEALGRTVHLPERESSLTVVGVVADVPPLQPGQVARPEIYWANRQIGRPAPMLLVRASVDPMTVAPEVTEALLEVDPGLSLGTPYTLASTERRRLVRPRFQAMVMTGLALVALVLSAIGVYAVVSYAVARRVRELGIRRALGAAPGQVVRLVVQSSLAWSIVGVSLGVVGAIAVGGLIRGMIPGVEGDDPLSIGGAAGVLLAAVTLAAVVPALRASRADPLDAIKLE